MVLGPGRDLSMVVLKAPGTYRGGMIQRAVGDSRFPLSTLVISMVSMGVCVL